MRRHLQVDGLSVALEWLDWGVDLALTRDVHWTVFGAWNRNWSRSTELVIRSNVISTGALRVDGHPQDAPLGCRIGAYARAGMERPSNRVICHVDMDAFFVSVELRRRPDLAGRPVVVGGTGHRGVVAAASYEARRFGVHSAMPSAIAKRRCPQAVFLPGDHALYGEVSAQVREILDRYTPLVEPLSLDEAFLDVTGSQRLFGPAPDIAASIRRDVARELSLGCSVGVAPNKFLAKLASVEAKPRATPSAVEPGAGVVVVARGEERSFLDPLPVQRLWGVGPVTLDKLHRIGIRRVCDFAAVDESVLAAALGAGQARHLLGLAQGIDDRPVEPEREAKSISHEETYATNKYEHGELHRELVRLADAVASRLRAAGVGARTLTLKLRFDTGFQTITRSVTCPAAVELAPEIIGLLSPMLETIDPSPGVRLLGVAGSNLGPSTRQLSLDDLLVAQPDWVATTEALDQIRDRFGSDAIGPASALESGRLRVVRRGEQQWGPDLEAGSAAPELGYEKRPGPIPGESSRRVEDRPETCDD